MLEVLGLVRTQTGSGPSSGAVIIATPSDGMSVLMRLQVAAQAFPVADVVRTRLLLESAVVAELAESDQPDLVEVTALLTAMEADSLTAQEFLALDAQFHLALTAAAGNQVVTATMSGLRTAIEEYVRTGAEQVADWAALAARLRTEHTDILAAIHDHDPAGARQRLHDHITGYYTETSPPLRSPSEQPTRRQHPSLEGALTTMVERHLPKPRDLAPLMQFKKPELSPKRRRLEGALTIADLRKIAKRRTPKAAFDYTEGAAEERSRWPGPARPSRTSSSIPRSCVTSPLSTPPARCSAAGWRCRSASPRPASPG